MSDQERFALRRNSEPAERRQHPAKELLEAYDDTFRLLSKHSVPKPLRRDNAQVLQLGTAGYITSDTFVDFVHAENPTTNIVIAATSPSALEDCRKNGLGDRPNVSLVQADALALDLPAQSFDWIETDGLLEGLPDHQRALEEWSRVLKLGGIFTTREWSRITSDGPSATIIDIRNARSIRLGSARIPAGQHEMKQYLTEAGLGPLIERGKHRDTIIAQKFCHVNPR